MTQTGFSNALVRIMVGWLKGLASWVLKLFNLAGSGGSPLLWLSNNWLKLLILFLVAGVVIDWLVWMIRWRPYWIWMHKKRIIVNDERMLQDEDDDGESRRYVVPGTAARQNGHRRHEQPERSVNQPQRTLRVQDTNRSSHRRISGDMFSDDLFEVGHDREDVSDFYEDEVFNVSNLPRPQTVKRSKKRRR